LDYVVSSFIDCVPHGLIGDVIAIDGHQFGIEVNLDGMDARNATDLGVDGAFAVRAVHPRDGVGGCLDHRTITPKDTT